MFLYRNILKQSWQITWHNKYLWFFGLFAALLGSGGTFEIIFRGYNSNTGQGLFTGLRDFIKTGFLSNFFIGIGRLLINDPISLLFILAMYIFLIFIVCFLIWLIMVSQAALINNAANIITKKKHNFKAGLDLGIKKFWPVFGLNVILKIVIYIAFLLISLPIISLSRFYFPIANSLFMIAFIILVPLLFVFSFIINYALAYIVIKNKNFNKALQSGCQLFAKNWLVTLEMALILFTINFLVWLFLLLILLIISIPFIFIALVMVKLGLFFSFWLIIFLALTLYLLITMVVAASLTTFQTISWTDLFIRLIGQGATSKMVRIFSSK